MRQDITGYSINELSLLVFNTEYLYSMRHNVDLELDLVELYDFTDEQLDVLFNDLANDLEELRSNSEVV